VATHIEKLDRLLPGALGHYGRLSERCHPNLSGHHQMFSSTDYETGTVSFDAAKGMRDFSMVLAGMTLLAVAEIALRNLEDMSERVSELHHQIRPSPLA
jgi:hypothetical protein